MLASLMLPFGEFAISVEFIRVEVLHFAYALKTFLQLRARSLLPALKSNERTRAAGPGAPVVRAVKLEALAPDLDLLKHGVFPNRCGSDDTTKTAILLFPARLYFHPYCSGFRRDQNDACG
jgi:hypothetical protein